MKNGAEKNSSIGTLKIADMLVSGIFQQFYLVERFFSAGYLMETQEVIISNPKRDTVNSAILCTMAAGNAVGFLECTVQALDELLQRAEFFG